MLKKNIYFLIVFQLIFITIVAFNLFGHYKTNQILYEDTTEIAINLGENLYFNPNEFSEYLTKISKKNDVSISRYVFRDDNKVIIYTTNSSLNSRVNLKKGEFIKNRTKQFLSTTDTNDADQVGVIKQPFTSSEIVIKDFKEVINFGLSGIYYVNTINPYKIDSIKTDIESNYGSVDIVSQTKSFYPQIDDSLVIGLLLVTLFIYISIFYYFANQLKSLSILKINGYSRKDIVINFIVRIIKVILLAITTVYVLLVAVYCIKSNFDYFLHFSLYYILYSLINMIVLLVPFIVMIPFFMKRTNLVAAIKGQKPYKIITFLNYLTKVIFIALLLFASNQFINNKEILAKKQKNISNWEATLNTFTLDLYYNGEQNPEIDYQISKKLKKFYHEIENELGAFLMDASNFQEFYGGYLYEANISSRNKEYEPTGKSVTINRNYLKHNPISAVEGEIFNQIINDKNTLNILVPIKYKEMEDEIKTLYRDFFFFQKVEVANIYNDELNMPLDKTKLEELSINIIYVNNNQTYFTYHNSYGEMDNYLIKDPIAILDMQNFHDSYYRSYISRCVYFDTKNNENAYGVVYPFVKKNKVESSVMSVSSVYDLYGEEIHSIELEQKQIYRIAILLILSSIITTYNIVKTFYEKNKMKLYVQQIHGYSFVQNFSLIFFMLLAFNSVLTILSTVLWGNHMLLFGAILIIFECIFIAIFGRIRVKKMMHSIIKGG